MATLLAAFIIIGIGVLGMCFNIIFRKDGRFPETEVSRNEDMRRLGIRCVNERESDLIGCSGVKGKRKNAACTGNYSEACEGCSLSPSNFHGKRDE